MDWTRDRIEPLTTAEVAQLRANALAHGNSDISALCDEVLRDRPRSTAPQRVARAPKVAERHLVSRRKAFEMQGIFLQDPKSSWGGVRRSTSTVIMAMWADDIQTSDRTCSYLLWAPNVNGSRPWSDLPGGKERLEHCRLALANGGAYGFLVHGERLEGALPEHKAAKVAGVNPNVIVHFSVVKRGDEFWATWGKRNV